MSVHKRPRSDSFRVGNERTRLINIGFIPGPVQDLITPGILHAKTIIRSETIFFATARTILEPGREFNY